MPSCEFMCLECGHNFEVFTTSDDPDEGNEVECPVCGSTQTTRTYQDGFEPEEEDENGNGNGEDEDEEDSGFTDEAE